MLKIYRTALLAPLIAIASCTNPQSATTPSGSTVATPGTTDVQGMGFAEGDIEIGIIARQWIWTAVYPGPDGTLWTEDDLTEDRVITVPAGREVHVTLKSQDVLHALFIPAARFKKDAVPGRLTQDTIRPMEAGRYDAFCTEYCGQGHSDMTATLQAVSLSDYREHLHQLAQSE